MGDSKSYSEYFFLENNPKVLYHVYSVCTSLKAVSYYDLSVLSMSVMGFKKNSLDGGGLVG